jgi:SAM-dependent methyltransferase
MMLCTSTHEYIIIWSYIKSERGAWLGLDAFAGVSNVSVFATIPAGSIVLDLGCGVDFSDSMLGRVRRAVALSAANVTPCRADAEHLPLAAASIDVALVNGIFNLNPARPQIFQELARVLRPGGAVFSAELILMEAVSKPDHFTEAEWFA